MRITIICSILLMVLFSSFNVSPVLADDASLHEATNLNPDALPEKVYIPLALSTYTPPPLYPNDPLYFNQWALEKTNALQAWKRSHGNNILIAVLDSGADFDHRDLASKLRSDIDKDFVDEDDQAEDDYGHGTHVAGIAAATTNNSEGVVGLGWDAQILALKVLDDRGNGSLGDVVDAIYYATDHGAQIINMSFSTDAEYNLQCSQFPALVDALEYAYNHGVLSIVSAGNDTADAKSVIPANCPYVLAVGASDQNDQRASYSNYGKTVDVLAPGSNIYSTYPGDSYRIKSGTSMAAPFVAGLASLVWEAYPDYGPDEVAAAILNHATDLGEPGADVDSGCGRVNVADTVAYGIENTETVCKSEALQAPLEGMQTQAMALAEPRTGSYTAGKLIVHVDSPADLNRLLHTHAVTVSQELNANTFVLNVQSGSEWTMAQELVEDAHIHYAQPDYIVSAPSF